MKIMHIVGNRPQFIKLALLHKELGKNNVQQFILHTGQHFDSNMSEVFFSELDIPTPDQQLELSPGLTNAMIGNMLSKIVPVIEREKPEQVIIYGDTNSTLAGALASAEKNVPIVHIEGGIRTGDESMPEENNRIQSDRLATINFCCTYLGVENLEKDPIVSAKNSQSFNSGDLMLDAVYQYRAIASTSAGPQVNTDTKKAFILATIHRQENTIQIERLKNIIAALNDLNREIPVLFPLHPNTRQFILQNNLAIEFETCQPLGYLDMLGLTQKASSIITDSGGLSRESFFLGKPTMVIMQHPFWPELFEFGNCIPAAAKRETIVHAHQSLMASNKPFKVDIFGDGHAAKKICNVLLSGMKYDSPDQQYLING